MLGLASPEERAEFEKMCAAYPEVKDARNAFELLVEKQAMENAVAPPAHLKQKIEEQLKSSGRIVTMEAGRRPDAKINWLRYAVAASLVLLAGSVYWNITLQNENKKMQSSLNEVSNRLAEIERDAKTMVNPNIKMARLDAMPDFPNSMATVYWDTTSKDVYLMVNNLPQPPTDKQYQLWALLNGQPIDMGMLEISEKPLQLYRMKNVQASQAFAITLEKKGPPKPAPGGKMVVMGKL